MPTSLRCATPTGRASPPTSGRACPPPAHLTRDESVGLAEVGHLGRRGRRRHTNRVQTVWMIEDLGALERLEA